MRLGRLEDFHSNIEIRLRSIAKAILDYRKIAKEIRLNNPTNQFTVLHLKGFGNHIGLLSCVRELFFNSRELLDDVLLELNRLTKGSVIQTKKQFLPFAKELVKGNYDIHELPILNYLKINFQFVFNIRKVRNQIKQAPRKIEFRYNTGRVEAWFLAKINDDELAFVEYINIHSLDEAIKKREYACTYHLDFLFADMDEFWKLCLTNLEVSKRILASKNG